MSEQDVCKLCINQATRLESQGRLQEAEKLLVTAGELDLAINMYRKARKFDDMIRLVSAYRRDLLSDTHNALAEQLDNEGHLREAEAHYVAGGRWKSAVNMYRANEMWDDAMRVARQFGGAKSAGQVCMVHAKSMGGDAGVNLLLKHGFVDLAITLALDNELYTKAEQIARESSKARLPDVFLKHAVALEDGEQFAEAEVEFLRAGNPREAVLMYTHQHDWLNATRVAESYCPDAVVDILVAQGTAAEEQKDLSRAEGFFVRAKKPELAVFMYERANRRADADRISRRDQGAGNRRVAIQCLPGTITIVVVMVVYTRG
jgi:intraflagellar transport protein 172